jgi:hypothetical protein
MIRFQEFVVYAYLTKVRLLQLNEEGVRSHFARLWLGIGLFNVEDENCDE